MKVRFKLIILAILSVFFLLLWDPINLFKAAYANNGEGSTIAGVSVSGLDHDEMQAVLIDSINNWITQPIVVSDGGTEIIIDPSTFQFDIDSTLDQFESLTKKPWYAFWTSDKVVHLPLQITEPEAVKNELATFPAWDTDQTFNNLMSQVAFLKDHQVVAVVKDLSLYENERLALTIEEIPSSAFGTSELAQSLNGTIVNPGEQISYLELVQDFTSSANGEALNFVASLLYNTVLQTEYEILDRHAQNEVPSYIEAGNEAAVNLAYNEDLKFLNTSDHVASIKATVEGNSLKVEIFSDTKLKDVSLITEKEAISPRIIYRYTNDLPIGQERLIQEGSEGLRVEVYRTVTENGSTIEEKISRDYYPPTNRIVLKSSRESVVNDANTSTDSENVEQNPTQNSTDPDLSLDLDGDGLADYEEEEEVLPPGSYYDKGGNLITP